VLVGEARHTPRMHHARMGGKPRGRIRDNVEPCLPYPGCGGRANRLRGFPPFPCARKGTSHLGCCFLRRAVHEDRNPGRRLLRIKEGKPHVSNASATHAVYHSIRGDLLRPANWHLGPRRAGRVAIVLPILPCRHKENHTSVLNFGDVKAERLR